MLSDEELKECHHSIGSYRPDLASRFEDGPRGYVVERQRPWIVPMVWVRNAPIEDLEHPLLPHRVRRLTADILAGHE